MCNIFYVHYTCFWWFIWWLGISRPPFNLLMDAYITFNSSIISRDLVTIASECPAYLHLMSSGLFNLDIGHLDQRNALPCEMLLSCSSKKSFSLCPTVSVCERPLFYTWCAWSCPFKGFFFPMDHPNICLLLVLNEAKFISTYLLTFPLYFREILTSISFPLCSW